MSFGATENDTTMKIRRVAAPEPTEDRSGVSETAGRHRAHTCRANGRETPRKAAKRAIVRWLTAVRPVWLRVWSPLCAQWFRVWPPLLGMVAGLLVDLGIVAIIWRNLTS